MAFEDLFRVLQKLYFKSNYLNMSIRDRKDEFLHKSRKSDSTFRLRHDTKHIEQGENVKFILNFLKKVEEINNQFAFANKGIADVIKIQNAILEFNETDETLFSSYQSIKKELLSISKKISNLSKSYKEDQFVGKPAEFRICNTQTMTLKKEFASTISYYYSIQEEYRKTCKTQVKRQAEIAGADVSRLNLDEVIGSKTDIFLSTVLPDYDVTHHFLHEVKTRHENFLKMENTVEELRDLFFDFALITQVDYALIDRIDKHSNAVDRMVRDSRGSTYRYKTAIKMTKFKKYLIILCLLVCLGIVIVVLITTLIK
ncbi:syntaxin-1A [Trichonephila inaurata madagascariensis]|uniref:Syntaxin-1A n=1 Tax=Trichonephila inaurata madagascariensis TaxID=2747483 RepID=A0A8X6YBN3_9ARAC|nr:syntaxin-1A [Trichonephila inaurata madagascariensis]